MLTIGIARQGEDIMIRIDDNGIGRASAMKFRNNEFNRKSLGMELTQSRIDVVKKVHRLTISYEVLDKQTSGGDPAGTTVIIKLHPREKV